MTAETRKARPFELKSEIEPDRYFIVNGQVAYVAEKGEVFTNDQGRRDARLRVIFDNGIESNMLMRSLVIRPSIGSRKRSHLENKAAICVDASRPGRLSWWPLKFGK